MTIELSPRLPDGERPSDYPSLAAEQLDLDNAINELLLRLEDHKYRWELCEFGLNDAEERRRVRAIIEQLQLAVHTGRPAVINPLRHALYAAHLDDPDLPGRLA
ncbi:hypothetical protein [Mycobacterium sp.]|uniref:hypothetical protein n=1 Tax=Mycobacterium sp. TaxID=1785 RepID=UPI003F98B12B